MQDRHFILQFPPHRRWNLRFLGYTFIFLSVFATGLVIFSIYCNKLAAQLCPTSVDQSAPTIAGSSLRNILRCDDTKNKYKLKQKGNFWVHFNYIAAETWFPCHESITFATTTDLRYLDNLESIVQRWNGPISIAIYAPGSDFVRTLQTIQFLRQCRSPLVRQFVSIHMFYEAEHMPEVIPTAGHATDNETINCSVPPPWTNLNSTDLYRSRKKLLFPINVGRNIARDAATTHFLLVSDLELHPSTRIIPDFLDMIRSRNYSLRRDQREVFVLPPFDVVTDAIMPETKQQLVKMLETSEAYPFQTFFCDVCHRIPKREEWIKKEITPGLQVSYTSKRKGHWEPFYIGTNADPYFDERLTWEGGDNKMIQAYTMCLLDYDYHILNNAFLVHRPGYLKKGKYKPHNASAYRKSKRLLKSRLFPELRVLFGSSVNGNTCKHVTGWS